MLDELKPIHSFAVGVVVDAALCLALVVAIGAVTYTVVLFSRVLG